MAMVVTDKKYFLQAALELIRESTDPGKAESVQLRVGQILRAAGRNKHGNGLPSWSCKPGLAFLRSLVLTLAGAGVLAFVWGLLPSQSWIGFLAFCVVVIGLGSASWAAIFESKKRQAWRFVESWYRQVQGDGKLNAVFLSTV